MADSEGASAAAAAIPEATDAPPAAPVAIFKKRGAKGKANIRKRPATPPPASKDSDDDSDSDFSSSEDETGRRVKRRRTGGKAGAVTASSKDAKGAGGSTATEREIMPNAIFEADRNVEISGYGANEATKGTEWFDEKGLLGSRRNMPPSKKKRDETGGNGDDAPERDGIYRGLKKQNASYIQRNANAPDRKAAMGPIKAPSNIRTITITDMAPDVCKDYKQTGFCGFGDNCKFLHAREDYAHGWQLDKEWENVTKGKKVIGGTIVASADRSKNAAAADQEEDADAEEEAMLANIPFVCIICRGPYKSPIVTRCGHYFCEGCALKRYRKDPGCAACGSGTNGVFNSAKRLQKLLDKKRERAARRRKEAEERGEEISEDEDDPERQGGDDEDEGE